MFLNSYQLYDLNKKTEFIYNNLHKLFYNYINENNINSINVQILDWGNQNNFTSQIFVSITNIKFKKINDYTYTYTPFEIKIQPFISMFCFIFDNEIRNYIDFDENSNYINFEKFNEYMSNIFYTKQELLIMDIIK